MGADAVAQDLLHRRAGAGARARDRGLVRRPGRHAAGAGEGRERGRGRAAGTLSVFRTAGAESGAGEGRSGWRGSEGRGGSIRAGPDKAAFRYFQDLLRMPERFMEGGEEDGREGGVFGKLLNYAFRRDGGMPWGALWGGWSKEVELGLGKGVKVEGWEVSVALGGRGFRVVDMQSWEVRWERGWARGS